MVPANPLPMTDTEKRMRALADSYGGCGHYDQGLSKVLRDGADMIATLALENHRLRSNARIARARRAP